VFASLLNGFIPSMGLKDYPNYDKHDYGFEESM
jgi:hypothetical protein